MSRIGKKPITIPEKVEVIINGREIKIKGPKGEASRIFPEEVSFEAKDGKVFVSLKKETKKSSAYWGLSRAILQNEITGVSEGFEKKLDIQGVGYRAAVKGEKIFELEVGFSHPVEIEIPKGIKVEVQKNIIIVSGSDKEAVGEFSAKIKRVRPVEPYKGKGISYVGEKIRRKEGKKAGTTTA